MTKQMSKYTILPMAGLLAVAFSMMPEIAAAQDALSVGGSLFDDVKDLIRGNLGVVIGLILSLIGLWMWLVQQASWGLVMVIGGAALTAFPGIYASVSDNIQRAFDNSLGDTIVDGDDVSL